MPRAVILWHYQNAIEHRKEQVEEKIELVNSVLKYFTWLIRPDVAQRQEDDEKLEKQPLPPIDENLDREFEEMKRIFDRAVNNQETPKFKNQFELEKFKAFEAYKNQGLRQNNPLDNTVLIDEEESRPFIIEDI